MIQKIGPITKSLFIMLFMVVAISSCKKDDPDPAYVGNWVTLGSTYNGETTVEMKDIITITQSGYDEKIQIKNPSTNVWIDYFGTKGSLKVNGTTMNITINEVGLSAVNQITGYPSGTITYYKSTQTEFTQIVNGFGLSTSFQSQFIVNGSEITLKTDYNSDADFNDEGEVVTYTRQ